MGGRQPLLACLGGQTGRGSTGQQMPRWGGRQRPGHGGPRPVWSGICTPSSFCRRSRLRQATCLMAQNGRATPGRKSRSQEASWLLQWNRPAVKGQSHFQVPCLISRTDKGIMKNWLFHTHSQRYHLTRICSRSNGEKELPREGRLVFSCLSRS